MRYLMEFNPSSLVDGWWLEETEARGYSDTVIDVWPTDAEQITLGSAEAGGSGQLGITRRVSFPSGGHDAALVEGDSTVTSVRLRLGAVCVCVGARDRDAAERVLETLREAMPARRAVEGEDPPGAGLYL
jgi:hypothetical protein